MALFVRAQSRVFFAAVTWLALGMVLFADAATAQEVRPALPEGWQQLDAAGFIAARHLQGQGRIIVLRVLGERIATLEAGSDVAVCRYCERSFVFNRTLYRTAPRTCFGCRILRRVADRH